MAATLHVVSRALVPGEVPVWLAPVMDLFRAVDTVTRRQTTSTGTGSSSNQFLNLISNPFESSVSVRRDLVEPLIDDRSFKPMPSGLP